MSISFFFYKERFDVSYFCPHTRSYFFAIKKINDEVEISFPFFFIIRTHYTDIIFDCHHCHILVRETFNYWEEAGDFTKIFQRCSLGKKEIG